LNVKEGGSGTYEECHLYRNVTVAAGLQPVFRACQVE
jgi:hypothetical protein